MDDTDWTRICLLVAGYAINEWSGVMVSALVILLFIWIDNYRTYRLLK